MPEKLKPGNDAPRTGDYTVVGPKGGIIKTGVTVKQGDTLPPTPKKNQTYIKQ